MSLTKRNSIIYAWRPVLIMNGRSEMNEGIEWIEGVEVVFCWFCLHTLASYCLSVNPTL